MSQAAWPLVDLTNTSATTSARAPSASTAESGGEDLTHPVGKTSSRGLELKEYRDVSVRKHVCIQKQHFVWHLDAIPEVHVGIKDVPLGEGLVDPRTVELMLSWSDHGPS